MRRSAWMVPCLLLCIRLLVRRKQRLQLEPHLGPTSERRCHTHYITPRQVVLHLSHKRIVAVSGACHDIRVRFGEPSLN